MARMSYLKRAEKRGRKFLNPVPTKLNNVGAALDVFGRLLKNQEEETPKLPLGPFRTDVAVYAMPPASGLRVTWFGHSGLLLEIDGLRVLDGPLVDPVRESMAQDVDLNDPHGVPP